MTSKLRQIYYNLTAIVGGVIGLLLLVNGIKSGTVDHINDIVASIGVLLGASGGALAGKKVGEQRKDGTFESATPADQIVTGAKQLENIIKDAQAQADQAKQVLTGVLGGVPVLGPELEKALSQIKF